MELPITLGDGPLDLPAVAEHQSVELVCEAPPGARLALEVGGRPLEPFLRPGETAWRWRWNPGPAAGAFPATLTARWADGTQRRRDFTLLARPRKLDAERYAALTDDLERAAAGLARALAGPVAGVELPPGAGERAPTDDYDALFGARLDRFERAARQILARPREQLRPQTRRTPLGQAERIDPQALLRAAQGDLEPAPPDVAAELQQAIRPSGGLLPASVPLSHSRPALDSYEHRLLRRTVELLHGRALRLAALAEAAATRHSEAETPRADRLRRVAEGSAAAARRLGELRRAPLFDEVGALGAARGPTPLQQRDAAYREAYQMWQALRRAPQLVVAGPLVGLPLAALPQLYESWCAIQCAAALGARGELRSQRLVAVRRLDDGLELRVDLHEDTPLLVVVRGDVELELRYQPRYRPGVVRGGRPASLDRHTRVPDLAIEARQPGRPPRQLILDAKYRLEPVGGQLPEEALADAYVYLGAIGAGGVPTVDAALILYPGTERAEHYLSRVGAIPLLPGSLDPLGMALDRWLREGGW